MLEYLMKIVILLGLILIRQFDKNKESFIKEVNETI